MTFPAFARMTKCVTYYFYEMRVFFSLQALLLARIFHTKSITACGKLIITELVSNGDLGGMDTYSPASQSFTRLVLTSFAQRLMTIQYEISGLNLFFQLFVNDKVSLHAFEKNSKITLNSSVPCHSSITKLLRHPATK